MAGIAGSKSARRLRYHGFSRRAARGAGCNHNPGMCKPMDQALCRILNSLVRGRATAALGTLDRGEPFVSMVPYVLHGEPPAFLIHVSGLSAHTRHMLEHPSVSLMVTAAEDSTDAAGNRIEPQALPRVTVQGNAAPLDKSGAGYVTGKSAYLERFRQLQRGVVPICPAKTFSL